ncbi:MAG TPA: AAA family ATPase [bacterium]|nr:AAA family ATPase [bacterium]HPN46237.1 AAA family ATPase [bacterium]
MQYQSLHINNFRGIEELEINDMRQLNLLVGRNNCGKSSILEALFLLSGMSNPQLPVNIHNFRNILLIKDDDFRYIFRDQNFSYPVEIKGIIENESRSLTISPILDSNQQQLFEDLIPQNSISKNEDISRSTYFDKQVKGLNLVFQNQLDESYEAQISLNEGKVRFIKKYIEKLKCTYLNNQTIMNGLDLRMESLIVDKKINDLITTLKKIEPNIIDIRMGPGDIIYIDLGKEKLFPVNIMGDGIRRIMAMVAAIYELKNAVLLIDEIENGLHYSSLMIMWKAIFAACKQYNVQLFATTHSYECIETFSKIYNQENPTGDDIRLYRIDKDVNKHKAYIYTPQVLIEAQKSNFEVR